MGQAQQFERPDGVKVTYRRMKFPFEDAGFDKYWFRGSPFLSFFWDSLSSAFRPGETFFIDSARALKGKIEDEALLEEMQEFCRQEGHHTAQHVKFNKMVAAQDVDMETAEGRFKHYLDKARDNLDPLEQLAVTCALEHFTAGFAQQFLGNPKISEGADPKVKTLWTWHALEELEHKATCFDVYQRAGGGYFKRIVTMLGAWFMIILLTLVNTFSMLKAHGKLGGIRDILGGLRYLLGYRGLVSGMLPLFLSYFRPGFHPWDDDNSDMLLKARKLNAGYVLNPIPEEAAFAEASTATSQPAAGGEVGANPATVA